MGSIMSLFAETMVGNDRSAFTRQIISPVDAVPSSSQRDLL